MSWWVAPSLAAELWGVPVNRVLGRIDAGQVPSRTQDGAVWVDVAPAAADDHSEVVATGEAPTAKSAAAAAPLPPVVVPSHGLADADLSAGECSALFGDSAGMVPTAAANPVAVATAGSAQAAAPVQLIGPAPRRPRRRSPGGRRPASPAAAIRQPEAPPVPAPPPVVPTEPARPAVPAATTDDEDEMGPDPNYGEVDDGRPLDWRAARTKATARRRPPPRFG